MNKRQRKKHLKKKGYKIMIICGEKEFPVWIKEAPSIVDDAKK